ncbi:MAG: hypothetical protein JJT89_15610 [Nitriliruptoraceae bacterium]|nr:hypothetical protein [Nitriliruptoraceae bacterium]
MPPPDQGPPPPPDGDAEARSAAARWLAGLGAVLLVAAAGAFLAAAWDALLLPARIGIVAGLTGAAIIGGQWLRSSMPAVGTALFHLGAVLVPVDVLGLALHLGVDVGMRTLAVGVSAAVVLPLLGALGRSPVLGAVGIAAVPVATTGVALVWGVPVLPMTGAVLAVLVVLRHEVRLGRGRDALVEPALVAVALAVVVAPLAVTAVRALTGDLGVVATWAAAGWGTRGWLPLLVNGGLITGALAWRANGIGTPRARSAAIAAGVLAALSVLLLAPTPRLALVLLPGLVFLGVEAAVVQAPSQRTRLLAGSVELLAALVALAGAILLFMPVTAAMGDPEAAVGIALVGVAWMVATVRRDETRTPRTSAVMPLLPGMAGLGAAHLAVATIVALPAGWLPASLIDHTLATGPAALAIPSAILLVGAALITATEVRREAARVRAGLAGDQDVTRMGVALATVLLLGIAAMAREAPDALLAAGTVVLVGTLAAQAAAATRVQRRGAHVTGWTVALASLAFVITRISTITTGPAVTAVATLIAVVIALGLLLWGLEDRPRIADTVAVVAGLFGLSWTMPSTVVASSGAGLVGDPIAPTLAAWGLGPSGTLPALALLLLLGLAAVRSGRAAPTALAGLLLVRVLTTGGFALGISRPEVAGLLGVVAVVGLVAVLALPRAGSALLPGPVAAAGLALLLVADLTLVRPLSLSVIGATLVAVGVVTHRALVGHLGGISLILAAWSTLDLIGVGAADAWLAPVAIHLWIGAVLVRRREPMSSWIADVPPLLLIAVPAIVERLSTDAVVHSLVAGGIALLAVVFGAWKRHAGPLIVGTVVLLVVVGIETLTVVLAVNAWVWLALAGVTLFVAAALLERAGSPAAVGRRVRRVLEERFD